MDIDIEPLRGWIGRVESSVDTVTAAPIAALSATLDRADPQPRHGDHLPILWHWLYFLPLHRQSALGLDGHARLGGFLPPVPLPRRMYAGNRVAIVRPLAVGDGLTRRSTIVDVNLKEGRTGPLVFVRVRHDISCGDHPALTEEQDIVYRGDPRPDDPPPRAQRAPDNETWRREIQPDEVLLFRYSALTFNGYRLHYDRPFAVHTQGYPGLVVHGPLIATLLADLVRRHLPDAVVAGFSFRAFQPLFDISPFDVCGRPEADGQTVTLWARDAAGSLAVDATATLA
ncbi:MAG: MaoC family dehydratase N-terminal domain-containing protein [Acidobacteriota bacterium]